MNAAAHPDDLQLRPITRAEYDRLVRDGWFAGEPIELLEGMLVEVSPEGEDHTWIIQELCRLLTLGLPDHLRVRGGHPWIAGELSEPEPDVAVVPRADYRREHPSVAALLIEVSASSRRKDLGTKALIYARAGVPRYWVVDIAHRVVHEHTDPGPGGYQRVDRRPFEDVLDVSGVELCLARILDEEPA